MRNQKRFRVATRFGRFRRPLAPIFAALLLGTVAGCAPEPAGPSPSGAAGSQGSGGATASGGTTGSGGMAGAGGAPSGSGGTTGLGGMPSGSGGMAGTGGGASGSGGTTGAGGAAGSAGAGGAAGSAGAGGQAGAGGGAAGTNGGSGGAGPGGVGGGGSTGSGGAAGAAGGTTGSGGAAGGTTGSGGSTQPGMAMPSAGCGKSQGRPAKVTVANQMILAFPPAYDGVTPFPLLIALHACGNPNTQWEGITNNNGFGMEYVRLFPNTTDSGQCWSNYNNNIARLFQQYDDLMANYCIDRNHVYGVGHSSGAQMLVNILSRRTDAQRLNFRAVSPVAADPYNVALPMPVLYIHGQMDNQRSATSAMNTVARFRTANMCSDTSQPYTQIMGCTSSGQQVDPGCRIYDNCTVPTIWCSHNDPNYSGTQHGIPCFALTSMYNFFKSVW